MSAQKDFLREAFRWWLTFFLIWSQTFAFAAAPGHIVSYALEWGSPTQNYTYVFAGKVSCSDHRPSPNTPVVLSIETPSEGLLTQTAYTSADGNFQIEVTLKGSPEEASTWKLEARSNCLAGTQTAEAEGRLILMDGQNTIVVERPLSLAEA
jgi:hypothetical protein